MDESSLHAGNLVRSDGRRCRAAPRRAALEVLGGQSSA